MSLIGRKWESTDPGAPVLNGTYGSLIDVLRAVLVEGYGSGSSAKAPAGWTEEFKGALPNVAVFRNNPVTGMGAYYRVDDSSAPAATFSGSTSRFAWIRGHKTMTSVSIGTEQMPMASECPLGAFIEKAPTTSAAAVPWVVFANELSCYLFIGNVRSEMWAYFFGDLISDAPGDQFAAGLAAPTSISAGTTPSSALTQVKSFLACFLTPHDFFAMRDASGAPGAVRLRMNNLSVWSSSVEIILGDMYAALAYPDPVSGGARFVQPHFLDSVGCRGRMPGLWAPLHFRPLPDGAVVTDVAGLPTVEAKSYSVGGSDRPGQVAFELGVAWQ